MSINEHTNATSSHDSGQLIGEYSVHLPETIQPYGVLFSLDKADLSILQVSINSKTLLGLEPHQLLGQSLDTLMDVTPLRIALNQTSRDHNRVVPLQLTIEVSEEVLHVDSFIHETDTTVILEVEPSPPALQERFLSIHALVRETIFQIQQTTTITDLFNVLVRDIRMLTGFDRVHVYQFDAQGAGEVIAEARHDELQSFLGLHFPEQDIPAPVREFYAKGKLRIISDLQAERIPLTPSLNPKTAKPLDLTLSVLRSAHPCCVDYYQNMGTAAALVISLIKDDQLWGLLSCHHTTEKYVSCEVRLACELLTQMTALEMSNKVRQDDLEQQARMHALQSELIGAIAQADNFVDALISPQERLLTLVNASGVAVCLGDHLTLIGATPTEDQVQRFINWGDREITDDIFHTNCLSDHYPEAETFKAHASGLLMLQISRIQHYRILWFRPEVLQSVNWAGNPKQVTTLHEDGHLELCPRASFEHWQELVYATSLPWKNAEIDGAKELRNAIIGIVLKKADELAQLNRELEHSNRELASFAYAAAHDLKEPLRGIYNYVDILLEDHIENLDKEGREYLTEIQAFSRRMETLINALLRISQLRQIDLQYRMIDLNVLLEQATTVVRASWPETAFELQIPRPLPSIRCDPALMNEVFRNLISNAIKYNDRPQKWVRVGYQEQATAEAIPPSFLFYVQDNGIGIKPEHYSKIFTLFRRLHPHGRYGGGTGVGLAIVNQIINRHSGHVWVESTLGEGSTFFFSVPDIEFNEMC